MPDKSHHAQPARVAFTKFVMRIYALGAGGASNLEGDFVIHIAWHGLARTTAIHSAIIWETAAADAVISAAIAPAIAIAATTTRLVIATIKQGQLATIGAHDHLGRVTILPILILPFAGFQLAFDLDL